MSVHVFVGPTLPAQRVLATVADATIHPPVVHGDLLQLDLRPADIAVIIDGYYHQNASIRHKEILAVLARGVQVVGCSSMGALRAAELYPFGMVGNGVVFGLYRDGLVSGDDEVAVTHSEGPEYRVLSEPLINIRHAAVAAVDAGALTPQQGDAVVRVAGSLHYTERVWPAIERAARDPGARSAVAAFRAFLYEHPEVRDVKARDAVDTLTRISELTATRLPLDWTASKDWRNRHLYDWEAGAGGETVAGTRVSPAMVARYQQVYHPGFAQRWRSFVLARIAEAAPDGGPDDVRARALLAAGAYGVTAASDDQLRPWLTQTEFDRLPVQEKLVLALTRSYRMPRMASDLIETTADLMDDPAARTAVAESHVVNAEMAAKRPGLGVGRIKAGLLRTHLAKIWQISDDSEVLLAAARDRGFETVDEAITALRPFFLRQQFRTAVSARRVTA